MRNRLRVLTACALVGLGLLTATPSAAASKTIQFEQGKVYEIVGLWVKPGKMDQLKEYFGKAIPIASKYGVEHLISFATTNAPTGDFMPQMVGINEWPSKEAFEMFLKDEEWRKLVPMRDEALEKLVVTHAAPSASTSIEFVEGRVYEMAGMWVKPDKGEQLNSYFQQALPKGMKYGFKPLIGFKPLYTHAGDFMPDRIGFGEWPSAEEFAKFQKDEEWLALVPMRDEAVTKLTVTQGIVPPNEFQMGPSE